MVHQPEPAARHPVDEPQPNHAQRQPGDEQADAEREDDEPQRLVERRAAFLHVRLELKLDIIVRHLDTFAFPIQYRIGW